MKPNGRALVRRAVNLESLPVGLLQSIIGVSKADSCFLRQVVFVHPCPVVAYCDDAAFRLLGNANRDLSALPSFHDTVIDRILDQRLDR